MAGQVMRFRGTGGMSEREVQLEGMIEELVWAMHLWGCDEDNSVHPDAYAAFMEALHVARIPFTDLGEDDEGHRYRFDPDWCQRQRVTWEMRQQASEKH